MAIDKQLATNGKQHQAAALIKALHNARFWSNGRCLLGWPVVLDRFPPL